MAQRNPPFVRSPPSTKPWTAPDLKLADNYQPTLMRHSNMTSRYQTSLDSTLYGIYNALAANAGEEVMEEDKSSYVYVEDQSPCLETKVDADGKFIPNNYPPVLVRKNVLPNEEMDQ
jgi:hypothetical protein